MTLLLMAIGLMIGLIIGTIRGRATTRKAFHNYYTSNCKMEQFEADELISDIVKYFS